MGPVVKKEFHFNRVGGRNRSLCIKTAARCEWDTANMKVCLWRLPVGASGRDTMAQLSRCA